MHTRPAPTPVRWQSPPIRDFSSTPSSWDWKLNAANCGWPLLGMVRYVAPKLETARSGLPFLAVFATMTDSVRHFRKSGHSERWFDRHAGDMILDPADPSQDFVTRWEAPARTISAYIPHSLLIAAAEALDHAAPAQDSFRPQAQFRDPGLLWLMQAMAHENDVGRPLGELYLQTLALRLGTHLLTRHAQLPTVEHKRRLSPAQSRRAIDFLEAHLTQPIRLETLAHAVGLSPFHLAKAFKDTLGVAPHQYVLQRRAQVAHDLLRSRHGHSLAQTAADAGFADQSHMGRAIRRVFGVTPGQLAIA